LTQIRKGRKNRGRAGLAALLETTKKKGLRLLATTLDVLLVPRAGILKIPMQAVNEK